jgi:transcriptional regulator with XRE-family HTH domain
MISIVSKILFSEWLLNRMNAANISQADLARLTGMSTGSISNLLSQVRNPSPYALIKISKALKIPPEIAFRAADLLPPESKETSQVKELIHLFELLPPDEREDLISYVQIKLAMLERTGKIKPSS